MLVMDVQIKANVIIIAEMRYAQTPVLIKDTDHMLDFVKNFGQPVFAIMMVNSENVKLI